MAVGSTVLHCKQDIFNQVSYGDILFDAYENYFLVSFFPTSHMNFGAKIQMNIRRGLRPLLYLKPSPAFPITSKSEFNNILCFNILAKIFSHMRIILARKFKYLFRGSIMLQDVEMQARCSTFSLLDKLGFIYDRKVINITKNMP